MREVLAQCCGFGPERPGPAGACAHTPGGLWVPSETLRGTRETPGREGTPETVDWVDAEDLPVGRGPRAGAAAVGLHHRVAATVCTNPHGAVLVYRRSIRALVYPGHHDVLVGGSVRAGETYRDAAIRELAEEVGIVGEPREILRDRHDDAPGGPCWLAVHHLLTSQPATADGREVEWCAFVPAERAFDGSLDPFVPVGRAALARLSCR